MPSTMTLDKHAIPPSALYTAGAWTWSGLACANLVTPPNARPMFRIVNAYDRLYRLLNPGWHSLKHTLIHRHAGIEHLLRAAATPQVIEIASGFSPRGSAASADPRLNYCEVDLPAVVAAKRRLLESSPAGRLILQRDNFALLAGDVTAMDWGRFPVARSTVITEGLMMYFERATQLQIWRSIANFLRRCGGEYLFDYLPLPDEAPRSGVGRWLSKWRGQPAHGFAYDSRTREQVADDLRTAGFEQVEVYASAQFAPDWNLPHPRAHTRVLLYRCRQKEGAVNEP